MYSHTYSICIFGDIVHEEKFSFIGCTYICRSLCCSWYKNEPFIIHYIDAVTIPNVQIIYTYVRIIY